MTKSNRNEWKQGTWIEHATVCKNLTSFTRKGRALVILPMGGREAKPVAIYAACSKGTVWDPAYIRKNGRRVNGRVHIAPDDVLVFRPLVHTAFTDARQQAQYYTAPLLDLDTLEYLKEQCQEEIAALDEGSFEYGAAHATYTYVHNLLTALARGAR